MIENNSPELPTTVNTGCADPEPITVNIEPDAVLVEPDIMALDAVMFCNMLTLPVTVKLADINTDWFNGLTEDAVAANEAVVANDAVVANEAVPVRLPTIDPVNEPDTTAIEPELIIFIGYVPNLPKLTLLVANASITGKPATVFTENNESDKSSVTANNLPNAPSIVSKSLPEPINVNTADAVGMADEDKYNLEPDMV